MNILMLGTADNKGGAAQVSCDLAKGLRRRGHIVRFLVGYKYSKSKNVHQLPIFLNKKMTLYGRHLRSYLLANDQDFGQDQNIIRHPWYREADIIHVHNRHGNFISLDAIHKISIEKPLVWTLHDMWAISSHCAYTPHAHEDHHNPLDCNLNEYPPIAWDNRKKLWHTKKAILERSNITFVSPSKWLQTKFLQTYSANKIIHISNGINRHTFKSQDKLKAKKTLGLPVDKPVVLFAAQNGLANSRKGGEYVLSLLRSHFAQEMQVVFIIIGGSIDQTDHNIHHIAAIKNPHLLAQYYAAANVYLFPSLADNCPLSVLESLSVGTPVVAFNTTGITELISHKKNGYLAQFRNTHDLKSGVEYLLKHHFNFKTKINTFETMAKQYEAIYKEVYADNYSQ